MISSPVLDSLLNITMAGEGPLKDMKVQARWENNPSLCPEHSTSTDQMYRARGMRLTFFNLLFSNLIIHQVFAAKLKLKGLGQVGDGLQSVLQSRILTIPYLDYVLIFLFS
jgi:hypothetical protein